MKVRQYIQTVLMRLGIALSVAVFAITSAAVPTYAQAPRCDVEFYSLNDIIFYNPCSSNSCSDIAAGGPLTGAGPSTLIGGSNEEKTWNYFIARGLTQVAAAGAMGNISKETGGTFSSSIEEASGGGGFGIIQWTGDRRVKLEAAAAQANVNLANNDAALLFELDYLWDGEYGAMTWQEQVNAEETVDGDTTIASYNPRFGAQRAESQKGNGSTMVFHALVERSADVPTKADQYSGVGVLTERIDEAERFLEKYGGSAIARGSCGNVGAGGLTWEQAVTLAKKFADEWQQIFCPPSAITTGGNGGAGYCYWESGYCTAGVAFIGAVTAPDPSRVPGIPNGVNVASRFIASNSDVYTSANPDGSNLQPFSIWSFGDGFSIGEPGHTGAIVGVNDDGSIITFEANWAGSSTGATNQFLYNPGHKVAVFQYPSFEVFQQSRADYGYTYRNTATPKDSSIATEMGTKMAAFLGGN